MNIKVSDHDEVMLSIVRQFQLALRATEVMSLSEAKIKIDVGLSLSAPHSIEWLKRDPRLIVIGVEPLPVCRLSVERLFSASPEMRSLRHRMILVPFALGIETRRIRFFECEDPGVSSAHQPREFNVSRILEIDCLRLEDLLLLIETRMNQKITFVQHLKTDCQGSDIEVLKGAGKYLDKIAVITCEADSSDYFDSLSNDVSSIRTFLRSRGFSHYNQKPRWKEILGPKIQKSVLHNLVLILLRGLAERKKKEVPSVPSRFEVSDPTFVNDKYFDLVIQGRFEIFQIH